MTVTAEELYQRGQALSNRGSYAAGRRTLEAAARRTDDPNLRARIAGTLSYVLTKVGSAAEAERMCLDALALPGISVETAAILYGQLGSIEMDRGRLETAVAWLGRSIDGLSHDPVRSANMRLNRSLVLMQWGQLAGAREDLELAASSYREAGLDLEEAQARHNLGYVAMLSGDLVEALQIMQQARALLDRESSTWEAIGDVDRAEVLRDAGLTTDAEQILERVARVFGAHGMRQARGEAEFNLSRSLLTHDPAGAARVAAAAGRRFRALENDTWAARAEGVRLRAVLSAGNVGRSGDRTAMMRGIPHAGEVDAVARALEAHGLRGEGAALRMTDELWRARHGADADAPRRVIRQPRGASMDVKLLAYEVRAARAAAAGREGEVRRQAAAGLELLSSWQNSFGSLDLQTSTSGHGIGLMLEGLASAVRSRRPDVLFEWSERVRHLSQEVIPLRPPPDQGLATDLAELRMLRAENPSGDWLSDARAAALRDRARERQWSATGSAAVQQRVGLEEFRGHLGHDTALLAFVFSGDSLSCLVVSSSGTTITDIGPWSTVRAGLAGLRADLDVSASVRSGPMATVVQRALDERLARLSSILLTAPLRAAGGARRLILTVPGVLNGIPWAMLPGMRDRVFTVAVSATRWTSFRPAVEAAGPDGSRTVGFATGPRVARADEEVSAAASAWPAATALRGEDATVSAVTGLASAVDVLHVASHGRHAADNPLFSGLELADGTLFGYDIDLMPHVPDTVVLSACEVGRSSVRGGEEALGMTRTWLHAGSRVVLAAPVVVADDVACELLGALHTGLVRGLTPSEALAAASGSTGHVAPFQAHGAGF